MPVDSLIVVVCVVAMFVVFGAALFWGDMKSHPTQSAQQSTVTLRASCALSCYPEC